MVLFIKDLITKKKLIMMKFFARFRDYTTRFSKLSIISYSNKENRHTYRV